MTQSARLPEKRGASTTAKCTQEKNGAEDRFVQALLAGEVPLKFPQTPVMRDSGNDMRNLDDVRRDSTLEPQPQAAKEIAVSALPADSVPNPVQSSALSFHEGSNGGNEAQVELPQAVEHEIQVLLADLRGNLSEPLARRTRAFDDFARGRLVTLLSIGMSVRQAAAALGVSHTAVRGELKRNPELLDQVTAARYQAQVEPLLVIVRESRRSWRAATWLVKHLQERMLVHEETPAEKRERQAQENDEYIRRSELDYEARQRDKDERARVAHQNRSARVS